MNFWSKILNQKSKTSHQKHYIKNVLTKPPPARRHIQVNKKTRSKNYIFGAMRGCNEAEKSRSSPKNIYISNYNLLAQFGRDSVGGGVERWGTNSKYENNRSKNYIFGTVKRECNEAIKMRLQKGTFWTSISCISEGEGGMRGTRTTILELWEGRGCVMRLKIQYLNLHSKFQLPSSI